jgi:hypothetical protein
MKKRANVCIKSHSKLSLAAMPTTDQRLFQQLHCADTAMSETRSLLGAKLGEVSLISTPNPFRSTLP